MPTGYISEAHLPAPERLGRRMGAYVPPPSPKPLPDRVWVWGVRVFAMLGVMAVLAVLIAGMAK